MRSATAVALLVAASWSGAASAQDNAGGAMSEDGGSPFAIPIATAEELATLTMPDLAFTATSADQADFGKYYYFNRPDTDVATAYADLSECDGYARGLSNGLGGPAALYPGGMIGSAVVAAIIGSAEKRRLRRVNMRKCMNFKGYERYGLPKRIWETFNFEEGLNEVKASDRRQFLLRQALVASRHTPTTKGLGL